MIIGYDAKRIVRNGTGLGNYARTLVNDMSTIVPEGVMLNLYAPDEGLVELREQLTGNDNVRLVYPQSCFCRLQKDLWRTHGITRDLVRDGVSLFHGLAGELPTGLEATKVRSIVTIHDAIFMAHPEWYPWIETKILRWKFLHACRTADRIIAVSECTKRDVMRYGGVPAERVDVVYQSCGTSFKLREHPDRLHDVSVRYNLPPRFIVGVGKIDERKNMLLAVKALLMLPADVSLVIVGQPTGYVRTIERYVAEHGLTERVRLIHNATYLDMPAIYQLAEAAVYPSRYEGFGRAVIEAIQSGLPVVACTGSCLEESGGKDTLYVSPDNPSAMAEAVQSVLKGATGREERIASCQQYITRFEGDNVARQVWDIYNKVL